MTISVEDEDEEKDSLLPFGLNQSWPRVGHPVRRNTIPTFSPKAPSQTDQPGVFGCINKPSAGSCGDATQCAS